MKLKAGGVGLILMVILVMICNSCKCQIPTQYYFANDTCEFYLPDYSEAVEVVDNCCVDMPLYQTPTSGTKLVPGRDVTVTLHGRDCAGNSVVMSFDVVVVDTIPPVFQYDSSQFVPVGMYQNEIRTWHFYAVIDSSFQDEYGNPDMDLYYREETISQ